MADVGDACMLRARQLIRTMRNNLSDDPQYFADYICELAREAGEIMLRSYMEKRNMPSLPTVGLMDLWEHGQRSIGELQEINEEISNLNRILSKAQVDEDDAMEAYSAIVEIQGFIVDRMG